VRQLSGCGILIAAVIFGSLGSCIIGPYVGFGYGKVPGVQPGYEGMITGFWGVVAGFALGLVLLIVAGRRR
jgi:hypothetical protein